MRIVFMGTPAFAVPVLKALHDAGHEIAAVITQPDRPQGRNKKPVASPVKVAAQLLGMPVMQPERIREEHASAQLEAIQADIAVTAAFGQILSERNLASTKLGVINAHASLLPGYRGPAPANWCIINGESITGVTSMYTDKGIDTGDIIMSKSIEIGEDETAGELLKRLSAVAAQLMPETLSAMQDGVLRQKQDEGMASYYPMLKKSDGLLDFKRPAHELKCLALGVDPWPGAFAIADQEVIKLFKPKVVDAAGKPGQRLDVSRMVIACGDKALEFEEVQAPGKKRMLSADFLRGRGNLAGFDI